MIQIQQLKIKITHSASDLEQAILKLLNIKKQELKSWKMVKQSIDARKKDAIMYVYTIHAEVLNENQLLKKNKNPQLSISKEVTYQFPKSGSEILRHRPVIIGMGPAGLFAALFLAKHGYQPILFERGEEVEKRVKTVERFWKTQQLDLHSNVQFGEGGAGTFSDGKLNTLVKDSFGRNKKVLEVFVEAGAPEDILYKNKPHIGTDLLQTIVKNIRKQIISLGGTVYFNSQVTDLVIEYQNTVPHLKAIIINGLSNVSCETAVLAIGHSARDTFEMLFDKKLTMTSKPFAVGVRIEHPQDLISKAQYGEEFTNQLPPAEYKLTYQTSQNRSVYSFCMCPGGYVVNASSEANKVAVNGMSYHNRDSNNANSAIVVSVTADDFKSDHPLAGLYYQRELEEVAYKAADGRIPVQLCNDFKSKRKTTAFGDMKPCIKGQYDFADLSEILPLPIYEALYEAIPVFAKSIQGFDNDDAILSGVESRTSSPVRIVRNEEYLSNICGIYPCGEGAGYAGGITSAAMDGMKVAEKIASRYAPLV